MGLVRKTFVLGCAAAGLAITSQAPEYAQQYRQRLGGAVEELRVVTEDFDRDAMQSSLSRKEALLSMRGSNDAFSRNRSVSMEKTINRFENLRGQKLAMERSAIFMRPFNVLASPDEKIARDAWTDFEPAVPLNAPGLAWGGIGALLMGLFGALISGFRRRRRDDPVAMRVHDEPVGKKLSAPPIQREFN